jgi:cytochrome c oxidase subunit II
LRGSEKVTGNLDQLVGFIQAGTSKMPAFKKLPADQMAELLTYLRNSEQLGNKVGDEIQPCQMLSLDDLEDMFPDHKDPGQECKDAGEVNVAPAAAAAAEQNS